MAAAGTVSGLQLLSAARTLPPFSTGHRRLDSALSAQAAPLAGLGLGLARRQLLQVDGPPGAGKSKLVVGIAVRARAASLASSSSRDLVEILFIDADGSLHPALIRRAVHFWVQTRRSDRPDDKLIDQICDGLHLVRVTSTAELGLFLRNLNKWLSDHPKVKMVILDSITAHTRYVSMSINHRNTVAKIIRDSLTNASLLHDCAVIVTSQLTTKSHPHQPPPSSPPSYSNKVLVPPDFRTYQWYNSNPSSSSSSSASTTHANKRFKTCSHTPTSKISKLSLMFTFDGSRIAQVIQNHRKLGFLTQRLANADYFRVTTTKN